MRRSSPPSGPPAHSREKSMRRPKPSHRGDRGAQGLASPPHGDHRRRRREGLRRCDLGRAFHRRIQGMGSHSRRNHYVEPGSALDKQAAYRGNSVPAWDRRADASWTSLERRLLPAPAHGRAAVTVEMEVSREGETKRYEAFGALSSAMPGSPTRPSTHSCAVMDSSRERRW